MNIDTGHLFRVSRLFSDREEAAEYVLTTARRHNIFLIRQTLRDDGELVLTCERYGRHRHRNDQSTSSSSSRSGRRTTKKCNCPFRISIRGTQYDGWAVLVMQSMHNHELARNPQSHAARPRFSVDERSSMESLHRSGVAPRQMWAHLHDMNPDSTADKTAIHNLVAKFRRENRDGRTDVASLMHLLDERNYSWWSEKDPSKCANIFYENMSFIFMFVTTTFGDVLTQVISLGWDTYCSRTPLV